MSLHVDAENGGPVAPSSYLPPASDGAHLYICGPGGFIDAVRQHALGTGWPTERIHVEHFTSSAPAAGNPFTVEAARSGIRVPVERGRIIAQALTEAGLEVLASCEQGLCGVCLTEVLEGIPEHHDQYQTDEEKASNQRITICCSRSRTPALKLDILACGQSELHRSPEWSVASGGHGEYRPARLVRQMDIAHLDDNHGAGGLRQAGLKDWVNDDR